MNPSSLNRITPFILRENRRFIICSGVETFGVFYYQKKGEGFGQERLAPFSIYFSVLPPHYCLTGATTHLSLKSQEPIFKKHLGLLYSIYLPTTGLNGVLVLQKVHFPVWLSCLDPVREILLPEKEIRVK